MRAHCLPRLDSLHSRLASSLVIPFAHHHVRVPQLWNTKLPCHMVIYNNSAVTIEQLCMHTCHCVMSVVSKAKAFYCWICFASGNIFFSRSWPTVSSFDKVWRSAFISFLKIVAIFTDCFGGQKIPHENCWPWKEELCTMHNAHQDGRVAITRSLFCLTWGKLWYNW